jgi:KaiC/GvpD/RAD55 family RecA-like ATPase
MIRLSGDGLPANVDAERFVLGATLLDDAVYPAGVTVDCFSTERHRRLWRRISDLQARGEHIDAVTLYSELQKRGEIEADTLSYITSLDDGIPHLPHIDSYSRMLVDLATRRHVIATCEHLSNRAATRSEDLGEIIKAAQDLFGGVISTGQTYRSIEDIPTIAECGATEVEYLRDPELPRGAVIALTGDAGSGKSTLASAWARDLWRDRGIPTLILDRENPASVIANRLERIGAEDGPGLKIWGGWLKTEAPQPDDPIVRTWAKDRAGLVVVDSLSAFHGRDQNDANEMRRFMGKCRRLADLGGTVLVIHHSGKGESSANYRGSSDFPASLDQGFHVSNFGADGRLDRLVLRPFKMRMGSTGEIGYEYAGGRFVRGESGDAVQTFHEQLTALLRMNPGVNGSRFEDLAAARNITRSQARSFLFDSVKAGAVCRRTGSKNAKTYSLKGAEGRDGF